MSISNLLNIGQSSLGAHQSAIATTGNNIANVNTVGYSRQNVRFEESVAINARPGLMGQGVNAAEIYRNFNRFVENAYLDRFSQQSRWNEQATVLQSVESLFNEANREGISSALGKFFTDWSDLSLRPDDMPTREALLAHAENLTRLLQSTKSGLDSMQQEMDDYIKQTVNDVNALTASIAALNKQISANHVPNHTNPNQLLDQRDQQVRKLAELVDIDVLDKGAGNFSILTKNGSTLVDGQQTFTLDFAGPRVQNHLKSDSQYKGSMVSYGSDSHEYTFEIVTPPIAGDLAAIPPIDPATGTMRVSLDGGKSWLRNEDGSPLTVDVPTVPGQQVKVKDIEVSFDADPTKLVLGDRFEVIPKSGLYWVSPTGGHTNITPQVQNDGTDNTNRLTGGRLTAYFNVRDHHAGRYADKLDALSNSLIWEVNSIHSQGAGTKPMTYTLGSYEVRMPPAIPTELPLGVSGNGLPYTDRLKPGNLSFQFMDKNGDPLSYGPLDFDPATEGIQNFDPKVHTLSNVVEAINRSYPDPKDSNVPPRNLINANIIDGKLQLTAAPDTSFHLGTDTTGLLPALGINTFFQGSSADDIAMKPDVVQDISYINGAAVNANGMVNSGDNTTAKAMAGLSTQKVNVSTGWENTSQSLSSYYAGTVGMVGAETKTSMFNKNYNTALAKDLDNQTAAISGVNLDEEMTSLIKFQHSYTAAAKLITTADQMLQTLLSLKQ